MSERLILNADIDGTLDVSGVTNKAEVRSDLGVSSGDVSTDPLWVAAGDLAVGTGASTAARLAKGTALQVLQVNAAGTALEYGTPLSSGLIVGTTAITGGTGGSVLYETGGNVLGELATVGSGSVALTQGTMNVAAGKSVTFSNDLTLNGTDGTVMTFPASTATLARTDAAQSFTGTQTFGAVVATTLNGNTVTTGTGTLTLSTFTLTVAGAASISGTNTGDQTTVSGNAGTATALATSRTIGGSSFDGTANVTSFPVPGAIGGTTPGSGAFTTLSASGVASFPGASSFANAITIGTQGKFYNVSNTTFLLESTGTRGIGIPQTGADLQIGSAGTLFLSQDAANTLAQRNGTAAQRTRIFNTWTNASNGEWWAVDWQTTANVAEVGTKANGTGVVRPMRLLMDTGTVVWRTGTGTPEGSVTAGIGSLYTRLDGGAATTLYVKESGTGNTGWIAK